GRDQLVEQVILVVGRDHAVAEQAAVAGAGDLLDAHQVAVRVIVAVGLAARRIAAATGLGAAVERTELADQLVALIVGIEAVAAARVDSVGLVAGGVVLVRRRQREAVGILDGGLPALLVLVGVDDLAAVSVLIGRKQLASQPAVRVELHVLANIGLRVNDRGAVAGLIVAGEGEVAARILGADHEIGLTVLVAEILGVLVIFADGDRIARARAPVVVALAEVAA